MKKCKKAAVASTTILIVVLTNLVNKCRLSEWDGYILQYAKNKLLTLPKCKVMQHLIMHISLLGIFV